MIALKTKFLRINLTKKKKKRINLPKEMKDMYTENYKH